MKKVFISIFLILSLFGCTNNAVQPYIKEEEPAKKSDKVKAVWLPYYELQKFTENSTEEEFRSKIKNAFSELYDMGFNTVTVQVRPCADAFYKSKYFPSSKYCFKTQGAEMPYDPLEIMCESSKASSLKIEAWVNPYRVSTDNNIGALSDNNKAKIWYGNKKTKSRVFVSDKGIYFNPASEAVTKLIVKGVKELVKNYGISAVHFDDYFYPTADKKIDKKEYKKYKADGGRLSLDDFRRKNVSEMIKSVYSAVKSVNSGVRFGVSPAANIKSDYEELFADVEKWSSEEGYIDYICPQIYFGFRNVYQPFMFTVKKWMYITKCDMYAGLPLYKANRADKYAASENKSIINEFKNNDNIIQRQINYLSKLDEIDGVYIFSYGCLKNERCKRETENMLKALKDY